MSSIFDKIELHFTGLRDRILARSTDDYARPGYLLGQQIVRPTKPNEPYTAYFLWPHVVGLLCLFLPIAALISDPHPPRSRFLSLAATALLAGHNFLARLYMMLDTFAWATPYFGAMFLMLVQVLILYDLLSMRFWNRRARRIQESPLSPTVWPPPPTIPQ